MIGDEKEYFAILEAQNIYFAAFCSILCTLLRTNAFIKKTKQNRKESFSFGSYFMK